MRGWGRCYPVWGLRDWLTWIKGFKAVWLCVRGSNNSHYGFLCYIPSSLFPGTLLYISVSVSVQSLSRVQLFATPWTRGAWWATIQSITKRHDWSDWAHIVTLIHMSFFWCPYHIVLITVALLYYQKSGSVLPSALLFFFRILLSILGHLWFHINVGLICCSSLKNLLGNLIGITLNL